MFMSEEIRKEWRKAIWSIVIAAVLAIGGGAVQIYVVQRTISDQLQIMRKEQDLIRQKIDLIQIELQRKVNRNTLDDCLNGIDLKLDKISDNIFVIQQNSIKH